MKHTNQITGLVLLTFSAFIARESLDLGLQSSLGSTGPGPGFFPFGLALFLGLMSALMLYRATFGESEPMPSDFFPSRAGYLRIGAILLALVGTVVLMEPLGFRLTTFAFLLLLLLALGRHNLVVTGSVAIAGSFGVFFVFTEWLKVVLPVGMLGL